MEACQWRLPVLLEEKNQSRSFDFSGSMKNDPEYVIKGNFVNGLNVSIIKETLVVAPYFKTHIYPISF